MREYLLFELVFTIVDRDRVVVTIEAVYERLNGRLLQMAEIGRGLTRLVAEHHRVGVDEPKGVDDDLALHALYGIDHDGHGSFGQRLETLLRVDVHARQPAAEARMRVVPADDHLGPARLLQHVQHLRLKH